MCYRRLTAFVIFVSSGCANATPNAERVVVPVATQTSEPSKYEADTTKHRHERCVVRGDGRHLAAGDLELFADPDRALPLLVARGGVRIELAWSELGRDDEVARVEMGGQGLVRASGWAMKPGAEEFHYRRDVYKIPDHVFAPAGLSLERIVRDDGNLLVVEHKTGLLAPRLVELRVPCRDLKWGVVTRAFSRESGIAETTEYPIPSNHITLLDAPGGKRVIELSFPKPWTARHLERSGDHAHVHIATQSISFEGWTPLSSLLPPYASRHAVPSDTPTMPMPNRVPAVMKRIATVRADTPFFVGGDRLREAGVLERGVLVRPGTPRDELVEIEIDTGYVFPPPGQRFFTRQSALTDAREEDRSGVWKPPPLDCQ